MLEFELPANAQGLWSVAVTGDLYRPTTLQYLGISAQAGAQQSPITLGMAIGPVGVNPYDLPLVNALADQAHSSDPAFVATANVPVPRDGAPKSLYVVYNYAVINNIPYSVFIYKVSATPPTSLSSRPGTKRGYFS